MRAKLDRSQLIADAALRTYAKADSRLEAALTFLERADSHRTSITASMGDFVMGGEQRDKLADSIHAIECAIEAVEEQVTDLGEGYLAISGVLDSLDGIDPVAAKMLRKVYLETMTPQDAGESLGYSKAQAYRIWKRGLEEVYALSS